MEDHIRWRDETTGGRPAPGAEIQSHYENQLSAGRRVAVVLFGEVRVFLRPHPSPNTDKDPTDSIRKWLEKHGVAP